MALIADLEPHILPEVQQASLPLIASVSKRVLRDFCTKTRIWQGSITAFNTAAGTATYAMTPPAEAEIARIESARFAEYLLQPITEDELDKRYLSWDSISGAPTHYYTRASSSISFFPKPDSIGQVTARVTLRPSASTLQMPDFVYADHLETLTAGIKAALMMMPEAAWANPSMAGVYAGIYDRGISTAAASAFRGMTRATRRTVPQFM